MPPRPIFTSNDIPNCLGTEPGLNFARRNIFWKCGPMFTTYGKPSADKLEQLDKVEYATGDPGFVNAAKGDFRLKPDAEVVNRMGFRPIPADEVGLYAHRFRASWPVELGKVTSSALWPSTTWSASTAASTSTTFPAATAAVRAFSVTTSRSTLRSWN